MNYEDRIREIIGSKMENSELLKGFPCDAELQDIGLDSVTFINIVITIEDEFNIEFPEDKLLISEAGSISSLCQTVESVIK